MMIWKRSPMLTIALALILPAAVIAQDPPPPQADDDDIVDPAPMVGAPGMVLMLEDELELTPEQRTQLESLHEEAREDFIRAQEQMESIRQELDQLMEAEELDEQAAAETAERAGEAHREMVLAMLRTGHQVAQLLTPEQREQLERLQEEPGHGQHGPSQRRDGGHHMDMRMMHWPFMMHGEDRPERQQHRPGGSQHQQ